MAYLEHKRKVILIAFIILLSLQVLLVGYLGERAIRAKSEGELLTNRIAWVRHEGLAVLHQSQSNELRYLSESWFNWGWDTERGDWEAIYERFIGRMVVGRMGPDGARMTVVFDSYGNILHAGAGGESKADSLSEHALLRNNILYPSVLIIDDIHWHKIVIPTPTGESPTVSVFYGFDENILLHELVMHLRLAETNAENVYQNNEIMFWVVSIMMLLLIVIGMVIAVTLRQAEGEVMIQTLQNKGW